MWQDIVIGVANLLFTYSLVYQVYMGFKEKKGFLSLQASLITAIGLYALSIAYVTLDLYLSTIICFFNGTLWFMLFVQRLVYVRV